MIEQPAVLVADLVVVDVVHHADQAWVGLYLRSAPIAVVSTEVAAATTPD